VITTNGTHPLSFVTQIISEGFNLTTTDLWLVALFKMYICNKYMKYYIVIFQLKPKTN